MADIFSTMGRLSFGGIEWPFSEISIKGSLRHFLHQFIKRPGGEVETLARHAYQISVRTEMLRSVVPIESFSQWIDLYPSRLSALTSLFEQGAAQDLFLPQLGRAIRCKAIDWTRSIMASKRSGEAFEATFLEDSTELYTMLNLIGASAAALVPKAAALQVQVEALDSPPATSALAKVLATLETYLALKDDATDGFEAEAANLDAIVGACAELARVPSMNEVPAARANLALLRFWSITIQLRDQQLAASTPLLLWTTPRPAMNVVDVALDLYGSPARSLDLLRLNDFEDAVSLPLGTPVRYLAAA